MTPLEITHNSVEYGLIKSYYRGGVATRSQVPLINHIDEGLVILNRLGAWPATMQAFCLHPLLQNNPVFESNWKKVCHAGASNKAVLLAMEYRRCANAYLCTAETDHYTQEDIAKAVGLVIPPIRLLLIADKVQNQKDFRLYHRNTHARKEQLEQYFINWLQFLKVDDPQEVLLGKALACN